MGRPRTSEKVLELRGSFRKDPQRRRVAPTPKAGIGPCPDDAMVLSTSEAWDFLVGIVPNGVLADRDRAYRLIAAKLFSLLTRVGIEEMDPPKLNRLEVMLGKLGLNPADASRVGQYEPEAPKNPFAED